MSPLATGPRNGPVARAINAQVDQASFIGAPIDDSNCSGSSTTYQCETPRRNLEHDVAMQVHSGIELRTDVDSSVMETPPESQKFVRPSRISSASGTRARPAPTGAAVRRGRQFSSSHSLRRWIVTDAFTFVWVPPARVCSATAAADAWLRKVSTSPALRSCGRHGRVRFRTARNRARVGHEGRGEERSDLVFGVEAFSRDRHRHIVPRLLCSVVKQFDEAAAAFDRVASVVETNLRDSRLGDGVGEQHGEPLRVIRHAGLVEEIAAVGPRRTERESFLALPASMLAQRRNCRWGERPANSPRRIRCGSGRVHMPTSRSPASDSRESRFVI